MIKVCSLDFLNKETFDIDIKTFDGRTLCHSWDEVTPELILRLYFKEIYVDKQQKEKPTKSKKQKEIVKNKTKKQKDIITSDISFEEQAERKKTVKKALSEIDLSKKQKDIVAPTIDLDVKEKKKKTSKKNSKQTLLDMNISEGQKEIHFSTVKLDNKISDEEEKNDKKVKETVRSVDQKIEKLEFDEDRAKRISQNAFKLGKELGFSKKELEDIRQAGYYCNIGIKKFTKEDLNKKDFEIKKASESYRIVLKEGKISENAAEAIKFHISDYESTTFVLDQRIPYYHVISIVYYYEKLLSQNDNKQKVLEKMLQLGGNKFNIFALHKFIRMMREANE